MNQKPYLNFSFIQKKQIYIKIIQIHTKKNKQHPSINQTSAPLDES